MLFLLFFTEIECGSRPAGAWRKKGSNPPTHTKRTKTQVLPYRFFPVTLPVSEFPKAAKVRFAINRYPLGEHGLTSAANSSWQPTKRASGRIAARHTT